MPTLNTSMQGKMCLVTGATSGIGKATVMWLAQRGTTVVMVGRDREKGEAVQREIKSKSGNEAVDLLLDVLEASAPARIVNVSTAVQKSGYIKMDGLQAEKRYSRAYGQSKLAIVLFTYELARKL